MEDADHKTLRVVDLDLDEALDLKKFLESELRGSNIEVLLVTEQELQGGLSALVPPELLIHFMEGMASGAGMAVGRLLTEKIRSWARGRKRTRARIVDARGTRPTGGGPEA